MSRLFTLPSAYTHVRAKKRALVRVTLATLGSVYMGDIPVKELLKPLLQGLYLTYLPSAAREERRRSRSLYQENHKASRKPPYRVIQCLSKVHVFRSCVSPWVAICMPKHVQPYFRMHIRLRDQKQCVSSIPKVGLSARNRSNDTLVQQQFPPRVCNGGRGLLVLKFNENIAKPVQHCSARVCSSIAAKDATRTQTYTCLGNKTNATGSDEKSSYYT